MGEPISPSGVERIIGRARGMPWWGQLLVAGGGLTGIAAILTALIGPVSDGLRYLAGHPMATLVVCCTTLVIVLVAGLAWGMRILWLTVIALRLQIEGILKDRIAERQQEAQDRLEIDRQTLGVLRELGMRADSLETKLNGLRTDLTGLIHEKHPSDAVSTGSISNDQALEPLTQPFPPEPDERDPRHAPTIKRVFRTPRPT